VLLTVLYAVVSFIGGLAVFTAIISLQKIAKAPDSPFAKFVERYQQLLTGTCALVLAFITVLLLTAANNINTGAQERLERVGAYVISDALLALETDVYFKSRSAIIFRPYSSNDDSLDKFETVKQVIKLPAALSDFNILQTQTAETLSSLADIRTSISVLNSSIAIESMSDKGVKVFAQVAPADLKEQAKTVEGELFAVRCELSEITGLEAKHIFTAEAREFREPLTCDEAVRQFR